MKFGRVSRIVRHLLAWRVGYFWSGNHGIEQIFTEVFVPGLKTTQSASFPFQLGYRWMLLHYFATRLLATVSQMPVKERNAFPVEAIELCAMHLRPYDVEFPIVACAGRACVPMSPALRALCQRHSTEPGRRVWFIDHPFDRDDFKRWQCEDLLVLAQHVLHMSNSCGNPTNALGKEFPLAEWQHPLRDVSWESAEGELPHYALPLGARQEQVRQFSRCCSMLHKLSRPMSGRVSASHHAFGCRSGTWGGLRSSLPHTQTRFESCRVIGASGASAPWNRP
jgi:hypothetical protein